MRTMTYSALCAAFRLGAYTDVFLTASDNRGPLGSVHVYLRSNGRSFMSLSEPSLCEATYYGSAMVHVAPYQSLCGACSLVALSILEGRGDL